MAKLSKAQQIALDFIGSGQPWEVFNQASNYRYRVPLYATYEALARKGLIEIVNGIYVVSQ